MEGSFIEPVRKLVKSFMNRVAKDLDKLSGGRLTPNMITITGLLAHIPIAWLIATNQYVLAAILLVIFGLFDALDGALARYKHMTDSKKGMFLDSVTDRIKEVILYTGIAYSFVNNGQPSFAVWAVLACGSALTISYVNAWGEATTAGLKVKSHKTNNSFRLGLTFDVRMFVLVVGLLFTRLEVAVVLLAVLSWITIGQRINNVMKKFDVQD